jgi:hypothetical protein
MFGLFKSAPFIDPQLAELRRSGGAWRGTLAFDASLTVPLVLPGSRSGPDPVAIRMARSVPEEFPSWRPAIESALFEHFSPYAEAVTAGALDPPSSGLPKIEKPDSVWPFTTVEFVQVAPLDGVLMVEIGYRVAWDEEHTLGARIRDGQLLELCGSVLCPW